MPYFLQLACKKIGDKRCDNRNAHDGTLDDVNMDSLPHEKATVLIDQERCPCHPCNRSLPDASIHPPMGLTKPLAAERFRIQRLRLQMNPLIVTLLLVGLLLVGCTDSGPSGLQRIADDAAEVRGGDGFLVAITDAEGKRTTAVAGVDATGAPMSDDVTWHIGSVTKTFVAVVIMQLADEGLLSLDDRASSYVDHDFVPAAATIFDLLHHSSGVPDYVASEEWVTLMRSCPDETPNTYDYVSQESLFDPGTEWSYSNTNYLLLGEVIEQVTGMPPETVIRHRILEPIGLADTYTADVESGPPPVPAVADFFDTGFGPVECDTAPVGGVTGTDSRMISSVDDLDAFFRALFDGKLVSEDSLEAMTSEHYVGSAESGYGLGMIHLLKPPTDEVDIWANGGGVVGYKTLVFFDLKSRTTVIAMTPTGHDIQEQDDILRWAFGQRSSGAQRSATNARVRIPTQTRNVVSPLFRSKSSVYVWLPSVAPCVAAIPPQPAGGSITSPFGCSPMVL